MKARTLTLFVVAAFLATTLATRESAAARAIPKLSAKERAAKIAALPADDQKWLEEYVNPIILEDERDLFIQLTEPHQREIFREEFWARREQAGLPDPLGPGYRNRYASFREAAATEYDGLTTDAGRVVIIHGIPIIQEFRDCNEVFRSVEVWTYPNQTGGTGVQKELQFLFYRPTFGGIRKLWYPAIPERELLAPSSCLGSAQQACRPAGVPGTSAGVVAGGGGGGFCPNNVIPQTCDAACAVVATIERIKARGVADIAVAMSTPPPVSTEGLEKLAERFATLPDAGAKPLTVQSPGGTAPAGDAVAPTSPSAKVTEGKTDAAANESRPAPSKRELSKKEMKALAEALPPKYRDFLSLTELIITEDEKEVFLQIKEDYQRDKFIENFWKRRSIDSMGIRTDYRAVYTRRVQQALEQFGDLRNDRAKVFVLQGPPDAVVPIECQDIYVPLQIWYYERMEVLRTKLYLIFYEPYGMPPWKMWLPIDGRGVLLVGFGGSSAMNMGARPVDITRCYEWRTVEQALQYSSAALGVGRLLARGGEQADSAAQGRDRGRRADPFDDDGSPRGLDRARRAEAGALSRGPGQQDRHGPLASRPEGRAQAAGSRRGVLLQRRRHRRSRQGRPADRQLQVSLRHPDRRGRRREDPADGPAIPVSRRLQAHPQGVGRQPERRGPHRRSAHGSRAAGRASAPDRRGPRRRQGGHRADQGRRPAALGDLAAADRQGDRHGPPAVRDEGRRERQDRGLLPQRLEDHDAHEGALRRGPQHGTASPQADHPSRGLRPDRPLGRGRRIHRQRGARSLQDPDPDAREGGAIDGPDARPGGGRGSRRQAPREARVLFERRPGRDALPGALRTDRHDQGLEVARPTSASSARSRTERSPRTCATSTLPSSSRRSRSTRSSCTRRSRTRASPSTTSRPPTSKSSRTESSRRSRVSSTSRTCRSPWASSSTRRRRCSTRSTTPSRPL